MGVCFLLLSIMRKKGLKQLFVLLFLLVITARALRLEAQIVISEDYYIPVVLMGEANTFCFDRDNIFKRMPENANRKSSSNASSCLYFVINHNIPAKRGGFRAVDCFSFTGQNINGATC